MKNSHIKYLALTLLLVFSGFACDNSSGPDEEGSGNPAIVEGRVDTLSSSSESGTTATKFKQVEGAVVKAMRLNSGGMLESLGTDSTETNAEGEFSLEITAEGLEDVSDGVVITAEQDGNRAKAFVTSTVEHGGTARAKPLSVETTIEATIYQQLTAQGNMDQVTNADIEAVVNPSVATDIDQDSSLAAEVASALVAKEQAKAEFYNNQEMDVPQSQLDDIRDIETDAQQELESRLSTTNEAGVTDAYNAFFETYANADIEAEINPTDAAKSNEVGSRVVVNQLSVLSDTAQFELRIDAAYIKTYALTAGIQEQLQNMDASQEGLDDVEQAAEELRTALRSLEGDVPEEDIQAVFEDFQQEVIGVIRNEEDLNGELFAAAHASINNTGGAKSTLESSLEGSADVLSVMDAYDQFYSNVDDTVGDTFTDVTDAVIATTYAQLLILINAPA